MSTKFCQLPVRGITSEEVLSLWHGGKLFVKNETVEDVERGTINEKFHRGLLKRVDYIEHIQRHTL